ncbi:MAG: sirohydrochlorin chelatase [Ectobacillus sp.]
MKAIVYVGHGSRSPKGNEQFERFVKQVGEYFPNIIQEFGFLELAEPSVINAVEAAVARGAKEITIAPALLFSAAHYKRDIPEEIEKAKQQFPGIIFRTVEPFGPDEKMIRLIIKRITDMQPQKEESAILLVGRGSSEPNPIRQLKEMAEEAGHVLEMPVFTAFLTAGVPAYEQELERLGTCYKRVYVMPYLLFTGALLRKIHIKKEKIQAKAPHCEIFVCACLEFDELMKQTYIERIETAHVFSAAFHTMK